MVQYLTGEAVIITDWLLIACAYVLVSVRLWFRFIHQRRSLTPSDIFLLIASVVVMAVMILFQKEYELGAMHKDRSPSAQIKKYAFATILLYHTAIYSTKFSILAFYAKLFPPTSAALRKTCFIAITYTFCCYLTAMFLTIFWCGPAVNRNFMIGPGSCTVWNYTLFKVNFSMNISSDILIFVLPFPLLRSLNLTRRQIVALCVTFGLGLITMIVSIFRCIALLHNAFIPLYVWSMAEICTAIMVSSLPSLRPLLKKSRRFMNSSPSGSGEKHFSRTLCNARTSPRPPTIGSGSLNCVAHARRLSGATASDIELIHVHMGPDGKARVEQTELLNANQHHPGATPADRTFHFSTKNQNGRPGDWV